MNIFCRGLATPQCKKSKTKEEKRKSIILTVVYICLRFYLLAVGSRDLFQAEKESKLLNNLSKFTKWQLVLLKMVKSIILSENTA